MTTDYTVYFEDGSSGIVSIEKPSGAHPESSLALSAAIREAEMTGKVVAKIGRSQFVACVILGNLATRDDVMPR